LISSFDQISGEGLSVGNNLLVFPKVSILLKNIGGNKAALAKTPKLRKINLRLLILFTFNA
jgi:hypothetical protein